MLLVLSSEKWKSSNKQESRYHTSWNLFTLLYSFLFQALNIFGFIQVSFMAFSCLLAERYTLFKEFGYHPKEFLFTFLAFATPKPLFSSLYWLKLIKTFQTLCFCSSLLPSTSTHYYIASFHFFSPICKWFPMTLFHYPLHLVPLLKNKTQTLTLNLILLLSPRRSEIFLEHQVYCFYFMHAWILCIYLV